MQLGESWSLEFSAILGDMKWKEILVKYSLEFFVIVLGISVSFWLNQRATERANEKERIKVLESLHAELTEIDRYCGERRDNYQDDIDILDLLLEEELNLEEMGALTTSKGRVEFILTHYRVFEPPMNQYNSKVHSGGLKFIKSDQVNEKLGRLHNTYLKYMQTAVHFDQEFKQHFLPFLTAGHAELLLARHENGVGMEEYVRRLHAAIHEDDRFRANMHVLSDYLENKLYFLKLYDGLVLELDRALEDALADQP